MSARTVQTTVTTAEVEEFARLSWDTGEDLFHARKGDKPIPFNELGQIGKEAVLAGTRAILDRIGITVSE